MRPFLPLLLAVLLSVSLGAVASPAVASAQYAYDPQYGAAPGGPPPWTAEDEAWLRRNRAFALAGKILTVVGVVGWFAGLAGEQWGLVGSAGSLHYLGALMWAGSELRGAKELRRRGIEVTKAPAIAAVVGAALNLQPTTWIAGPIQSARIRRVHDDILDYAQPRARVSTFGFGLNVQF
jgi:hypothetical protein